MSRANAVSRLIDGHLRRMLMLLRSNKLLSELPASHWTICGHSMHLTQISLIYIERLDIEADFARMITSLMLETRRAHPKTLPVLERTRRAER